MLRRVLAVVVGTLTAAVPAFAQCTLTLAESVSFRSTFLDLVVDGNDLWAATSYGIALYDRSADPPQLVASIAIPGPTRVVRVGGGTTYAGSGTTITALRRSGRSLQVVRSVDVGGVINDMVVSGPSLFAATSNGLFQYDLLNLTRTAATFQTSQPNVTSLALIGSTLYATDGDASVEVFLISPIVQRIGSIATPQSAITVRANNGRLYVASPLQTTVFVGSGTSMTAAGSSPFATSSLATISGDALFMSGGDRTLRAVDYSVAGQPVDLFRADIPVSGTVNRVGAVATAGGRLYVAAGDSGLLIYDISAFVPPFPMRGASVANASSVVSLGDRFYVGRAAGVGEFAQSLTPLRSWDGSHADLVLDGDAGRNFLLTSSGAAMTLWTLASTPPAAIGTATLRAAPSTAIVVGTIAYAVLPDHSLWSADFAASANPAPQQIATPNISPASIARSGSAIAIDDLRDDGTTLVAFYTTPDFTRPPLTATVPGIATTNVTLSGSVAAVQTFRGISLIDFASGTTAVLPQSNASIDRQLLLNDTTLLEMTDTTLRVWNTQARTLTAEFTLPSNAVAVSMAPQSSVAHVVTATGVVFIATNLASHMPALRPSSNGNAYYRRLAAPAGHIDLMDGRGVDIFSSAMHYIGSIRTPNLVDIAANDSGVFTLSNNLTVSAWSPDGYLASTTTIVSEGTDAQAVSIAAVNGALWVSIVRGCSTGGCEKKTLLFDPRGMTQTAAMSGSTVDVATSGTRAYAVTDGPAEVRVLDVSDAMHPSLIRSAPLDATPTSIAYTGGNLYVLGNTLAVYSESSLSKSADALGPFTADPLGGVTFADQHLRINGPCAVMTGRSFGAQTYSVSPFALAGSFLTPSPARAVAVQQGVTYVLTDHSVDIFSSAPLAKPPRRPPAR